MNCLLRSKMVKYFKEKLFHSKTTAEEWHILQTRLNVRLSFTWSSIRETRGEMTSVKQGDLSA